MDLETANYIIVHFSNLLVDKERLAFRHMSSVIKLEDSFSSSNSNNRGQLYKRVGWLTEDEEELSLVSLGEEMLKLKVAERIIADHRENVIMNYCPSCNSLARTPKAKQCRYCGNDWH